MKTKVNISLKVFNKAFRYLINARQRYLVLYGGAGSGKSYFIVQRYVYKLLTLNCNILVVRNTARSNRDSTFALFKQIISKWNLSPLFTVNQSDMRIRCANGNEVIFAGLDDVEKLKSITFSKGELTDVWVEEASEILESDFNQLDVRLRGTYGYKQICVSFNPININHWLKRRFIDVQSDDIVVNHSTYLDNDFLDENYGKLLESFKDTDRYYYEVYCLGHFGVTGKSVFPAQLVNERLQQIPKPIRTGYFDYTERNGQIVSWKFITDPNGYIKIYYVPDSPQITNYCIGGDTAGEGSDYFVGQVLDARTGLQVATLRHQFDADQYAKQMYCLGKYYKNALLSVEANFDTHPIRVLEDLGYPNLYVRETEDSFTGKTKRSHGFRTDSVSRPRIISNLIQIVREHVELFNDKDTLEEMLTFVRNEKGRPEAEQGAHDDLIMALAIGEDSLSQVVFDEEVIRPPYYRGFRLDREDEYSEDLIEVI